MSTWQVLKETLRYSITASFAARISHDKALKVGGHFIHDEVPILLATGVRLSDGKYFSYLDKFDPVQFSPVNAKKIPALALLTFGIGARRCHGYHFSLYEVIIAVSILCKKYELWPAFDTDRFVVPSHEFVRMPKDEIWIRFRKRS